MESCDQGGDFSLREGARRDFHPVIVAAGGAERPDGAVVVRGEKNGLPVTDGMFAESKEFLLGDWIVDVAAPERAYAIAARISGGRDRAACPSICR